MATLAARKSESQSQFQSMKADNERRYSQLQPIQATQDAMATNMESMRSDMALQGSRLNSDMTAQAMTIQQNHAEAKTTLSFAIETLGKRLDEVAKITKADLATAADRVSQVDDALRHQTARVNAVELQLETVISSHSSTQKTTDATIASLKKSLAPELRDKKLKNLAFEAVKKECARVFPSNRKEMATITEAHTAALEKVAANLTEDLAHEGSEQFEKTRHELLASQKQQQRELDDFRKEHEHGLSLSVSSHTSNLTSALNSFGAMVPYMGPIFVIRYAMRRGKTFHLTKIHDLYTVGKPKARAIFLGFELR